MAEGIQSTKNTLLTPVAARTRVSKIDVNELVKNVKEIKVNDRIIEDEDNFFNLIKKKNNNVKRLQLKNVTFDQQFYDKLPALCNQINYLKVENANENAINCDFVLAFRCVKYFSSNQYVSPQFMDRMCSNFADDLKEIGFKYREHKAKIILLHRDDYPGKGRDMDFIPVGLKIGRYMAEFDDLDKLFGFMKNIL